MKSKTELIERLKYEARQANQGEVPESKYGSDNESEFHRKTAQAKVDVLVWALGTDCPDKFIK